MTSPHYLYGLIGFPLCHSFSEKYFTEKFAREGMNDHSYRMFPLTEIEELPNLLKHQPALRGFNVTIPYKEKIIPLLHELDTVATQAGAVNTVQVVRNGNSVHLKGYNTDVYGFRRSLEEWYAALGMQLPDRALVLGTGGASKAVSHALSALHIAVQRASRNKKADAITYDCMGAGDIASYQLIVNTTPAGMYPETGDCPAVPYGYLTKRHCLYDLIYNPEETLFMRKGKEMGASVHNGLQMLHMQADRAWEIWSKGY